VAPHLVSLTAYSLGTSPVHDRRYERGQVTAKWVISPGVPIIAISVDENYSVKRHAHRRIWADCTERALVKFFT